MFLWGANAYAQSVSTLVTPAIASDYSRGRNLSVTQSQDPIYAPLGIRAGGFDIYPAVEMTTQYTNNVYINNANKRDDAIFTIQPTVVAESHWSTHKIRLHATSEVRRFYTETIRNRTNFLLSADMRLDVSSEWKVSGNIQVNRAAENPYAEDLASDVSVLSQYVRFSPSLKVTRQAGRTRFTASVERLSFDFNTIIFADGNSRSQSERDRSMLRFAAQAEYALSPSMSVYAQINHDDTDYSERRLDGQRNRDSQAVLFISGINFDFSGLMRGAIGVGYTHRNYLAPQYKDVNELSLQTKMEMFVSPLTTVTLTGQRLTQDASIGNSGAYIDNRATANVDHALLRNLIISMGGMISKQKIVESSRTSQVFSLNGSSFYQSSRDLGFGFTLQYNASRPGARSFGLRSDEIAAVFRVRLAR